MYKIKISLKLRPDKIKYKFWYVATSGHPELSIYDNADMKQNVQFAFFGIEEHNDVKILTTP